MQRYPLEVIQPGMWRHSNKDLCGTWSKGACKCNFPRVQNLRTEFANVYGCSIRTMEFQFPPDRSCRTHSWVLDSSVFRKRLAVELVLLQSRDFGVPGCPFAVKIGWIYSYLVSLNGLTETCLSFFMFRWSILLKVLMLML